MLKFNDKWAELTFAQMEYLNTSYVKVQFAVCRPVYITERFKYILC